MSSEDAPRTSSLSRRLSDPFEVKIHIFECGHGDTILVECPGSKWALIDCHLPNALVRGRFFEWTEALGVSRLEYVFQTLQENPDAKMEANRLSVILALSINHNDEEWNFLLPGDAGGEEIDGALEAWSRRSGSERDDLRLDVIKMSHHGSLASHGEKLPTMTHDGRAARFAVVSAGNRPKLPDRVVLEDYLSQS